MKNITQDFLIKVIIYYYKINVFCYNLWSLYLNNSNCDQYILTNQTEFGCNISKHADPDTFVNTKNVFS